MWPNPQLDLVTFTEEIFNEKLIFCAVIKVPNKIIVESKKNHLAKKIATLQCFWIKILSGGSFHEWKLIPLKLIKKSFGDKFKFHSSLWFNNSYVRNFPCFYKNILVN